MKILRWIQDRVALLKGGYPADFHPSVVLLLHTPAFPLRAEVEQAADRLTSLTEKIEYMASAHNRATHLLRCGSLLISIHGADQRYDTAREELSEVLQNAWEQHCAWLAIDLPGERNCDRQKSGTLQACYKLQLQLAEGLIGPNCTGILFPAEGILLPNLGSVRSSLEWAERNGRDPGVLKGIAAGPHLSM